MNARELGDVLAGLPLVAGMEAEARAELARSCQWLSMPGGSTLFRQGETAESMYVLLSGALGVFVEQAGRPRLLGQVAPLETVGEIGLVTGHARSATVRCLRDCELLRISEQAFDVLLRLHPRCALALARGVLLRAGDWQREATSGWGGRSFVLLPDEEAEDAQALAEALSAALSRLGSTRLMHPSRDAGLTSDAYHAIEQAHRYLLWLACPDGSAWTKLCLRQADQLLLQPAGRPPGRFAALRRLPVDDRPCHFLDAGSRRLDPAAWLDACPGARWHRVASAADAARVARLLVGQAYGLVLAGGGARGFAHIGVWKALRAHGIPVDRVAGTSIGAIVGAAIAQGWDEAELIGRMRRSLVAGRPMRDYTVPFVALVRGQRVSALLQREFGDTRIEDLCLPFACVSTDLAGGEAVVHRRGPVWMALRASSAIPGLLPPMFVDGRVLVDGGVIDNFPLELVHELGGGPVIGVDLGGRVELSTVANEHALPPVWRMVLEWFRGQRRPSMAQLLLRTGMVNSRQATLRKRSGCALLFEPPVVGIDLLDWSRLDEIVELAYRHASERLEALATAPASVPMVRSWPESGIAQRA